MSSQSGVARIGIVRGLPIVDAPMHASGRKHHDTKGLIARNTSGLVIESPAKDLPHMLFLQVALHGLRRLIENLSIVNRASQLDVLRVRPHQRTCGSGGLSAKQFEGWNIRGIPNLLGKQATL